MFSFVFLLFNQNGFSQNTVGLSPELAEMNKEFTEMVIGYIERYTELSNDQESLITQKINVLSKELSVSAQSDMSSNPSDYLNYAQKLESYLESEVLTKEQQDKIQVPALMPAIKYVLKSLNE